MHYILPGNFGNHSLAVMQYLIEQGGQRIDFAYVDTGWSAECWPERVNLCRAYAMTRGVSVHLLQAPADFVTLVRERGHFPSPQFQWCAGFLKGLALNEWLDAVDPFCEAIIVSGKRRKDSRRFMDLPATQPDSEHYLGRTVLHPLLDCDDAAFHALLARTGMPVLTHASLECSPCIHGQEAALDAPAKARLQALEAAVGETLFEKEGAASPQKGALGQFDRACGSPWNCGE